MSWFDRQSKTLGIDLSQSIGRYLRSSGIDASLNELSGPFGVRRFLIHFRLTQARIQITDIQSLPLQYGGGSPLDMTPDMQAKLERSLIKLHQNMSVGPSWTEGALGFIRNNDNQHTIVPFFDEDVPLATLDLLPVPDEGHPLESPEYRKLLGSNEAQIEPIWARTNTFAHEWDEWEVDKGELRLIYGSQESPTEVLKKRCQVLATFDSASSKWTWQSEGPLFPEETFAWQEFVCDWNASMELGGLTSARLGADWLFVSSVEGSNLVLFAAVWE